MEVPELKERDSEFAYSVPGNCLTWALEYAFGLGAQHASIGSETAARNVIQSMAGRNMIHIVRSHWVGLTEHIDAVVLKKTETEYEG